ncbi:MAG: ABC transporter ATP-binding protein [Rhodospirillales bacterium]
MRLQAENLGWSVRRKPILSEVSLSLEPGEVLGLIGPNGSGKTTLLRLLAGLLPPSSGLVRLDGTPLAKLGRRRIAQVLAFVAQQANTSDSIKVRDAVELGRTPWLSPLAPWSARDSRIVAAALEAVDLTALAERPWQTLSGGERQRAHIARALVQEPGILLLDEPTNHLDVAHQIAVLRIVVRLKVTTAIALHDLNHAFKCDRLGVLRGGRLVALGRPRELLTPAFLREVFGVCAHLLTDPADGATVLRFHDSGGEGHADS